MFGYNKSLLEFQTLMFNIFVALSYILYGSFALGFSVSSPQYLAQMDYYIKIYISLFLLWRFNPFRTITFNDLDRRIAFTAGLFLFTTTIISQLLIKYLKQIKDFVLHRR